MVNDEVKIGKRYIAKVGGKITIIKIMEPAFRGWVAKSCSTNRKVLVRSAQRLRRLIEDKEYNQWIRRLNYARDHNNPDPVPE